LRLEFFTLGFNGFKKSLIFLVTGKTAVLRISNVSIPSNVTTAFFAMLVNLAATFHCRNEIFHHLVA